MWNWFQIKKSPLIELSVNTIDELNWHVFYEHITWNKISLSSSAYFMWTLECFNFNFSNFLLSPCREIHPSIHENYVIIKSWLKSLLVWVFSKVWFLIYITICSIASILLSIRLFSSLVRWVCFLNQKCKALQYLVMFQYFSIVDAGIYTYQRHQRYHIEMWITCIAIIISEKLIVFSLIRTTMYLRFGWSLE